MKTIDVNNGLKIKITPLNGGIRVEHGDGTVHRYDDGEIVTVLNLLNYMRCYGQKSAYAKDGDYYAEFQIFQ